jgi:hypothetical protein
VCQEGNVRTRAGYPVSTSLYFNTCGPAQPFTTLRTLNANNRIAQKQTKRKKIKTMHGVALISQSVYEVEAGTTVQSTNAFFVFSATNFTVLFIVPFHSQIISNVPSALHFKLLHPVNITLFPRYPCSL